MSLTLHTAASQGDLDALTRALDNGQEIDARDQDLRTPLHLAASRGHLPLIRHLVGQGADTNVVDKYGETAFYLAATEGQAEVVAYFLKKGASPDFKNFANFTPLHFLARHAGKLKVFPHFERFIRSAELLIEHDADLDSRTDTQNTPLHLAAAHGPIEFVRLLLDHGADVNVADQDGMTPLHYAARAQTLDIVISLVEAGADLAARDRFGFTPLHEAAESGRLSKIRYLIEQGADPEAGLTAPFESYPLGYKPQDIAAARGHAKAARWIEVLKERLDNG
jgi:cytohesin